MRNPNKSFDKELVEKSFDIDNIIYIGETDIFLTHGRQYDPKATTQNAYLIRNDQGSNDLFDKKDFVTPDEYRDLKINEILK